MHKMTHTIYGLTTPVPAHIHGDKALQANVAAIVFLLVLLLALAPIYTAHAQDGQTPTPTPAPMYQVTLPTGNLMQIDRSISYGDIFIVCAIIFFTVIYAVFNILRLTNVSSDR